MLWPAGGCEMSPPKYLPGNPTSTGPVSVVIFWGAFASYLPSPWLDRYRLTFVDIGRAQLRYCPFCREKTNITAEPAKNLLVIICLTVNVIQATIGFDPWRRSTYRYRTLSCQIAYTSRPLFSTAAGHPIS